MFERRRPDPQQGVFETMLILDGRPVELEAHLARLEASLAELFPDLTAPDLGEVDAPEGDCVMRIDVTPRDDCLEAEVSFRDVGEQSGTAALRSLPLAGGLGPHKWRDRSLLDGEQAGLAGNTLPLVVDADGALLEASRANVFAVRSGALFTPPLDGRILPGITRMRVLQIAAGAGIETHESAFDRSDLLDAEEVFLTGSVRGIERVESLDGAPVRGGGEISNRIAAKLCHCWTDMAAAHKSHGRNALGLIRTALISFGALR